MHILLVEPDKLLGQIYTAAIQSTGHKVVHCFDAQTAIVAADKCRPDVVIVELQLAGHSGFEFLYEFRSYADWRNIPVIVHTGVPKYKFLNKWPRIAANLGISDYLYKPRTSLKDLLGSVSALVQTNVRS